MKNLLIALLFVGFGALVASGVEKMTTVPITGGFGITLGAKFTPQLAKKLKAKREKYVNDRTIIGYQVIPPKPLRGFTSFSVLLTKNGMIYKIQATYIGVKTREVFADTVFQFQKKYGMASGVNDELLYVDKNHPTRTIRISTGEYLTAVIYTDSAVGATDTDGI